MVKEGRPPHVLVTSMAMGAVTDFAIKESAIFSEAQKN